MKVLSGEIDGYSSESPVAPLIDICCKFDSAELGRMNLGLNSLVRTLCCCAAKAAS